MRSIAFVLLAGVASGCATTFYGSPNVEAGPAGCKAVCDNWGMDLAGMVRMGEYSDGCICQVRSAAPGKSSQPPVSDAQGAADRAAFMSAAAAAAAGAIVAGMTAQERRARAAAMSNFSVAPPMHF